MPTVIRTDAATLLLALRARLMAALAFPAERVIVGDPEDLGPPAQGDQLVYLWPGDQQTRADVAVPNGRVDTRVRRAFLVTCRTRLSLDEPTSQRIWHTDPALGHAALEHAVFDALTIFLPADGDGNALAACPAHLGPVTRPRKRPGWKGWGESRVSFELEYTLALDQTTQ